MQLLYFSDTDTLQINLSPAPSADTQDGPDEDLLLDFDAEKRLVSLTVEHASRRTDLERLRTSPLFVEDPAEAPA